MNLDTTTSLAVSPSESVELTALELLALAQGFGFQVRPHEGKLRITGPRSADPALIQELLDRKVDLMPLLLQVPPARHDDVMEWFEEHAAIREYEGGSTRQQAEIETWTELEQQIARGTWTWS